MATRLWIFLFSIVPLVSLFSFEFSELDVSARDMYGLMYEIKNQQLSIIKHERTEAGKNERFYENIDSSELEMNHDRYFYTMVFEKNKCIIPGSRLLYLFPKNSEDFIFGFQGDFDNSVYLKDVESMIAFDKQEHGPLSIDYDINLISNIRSSSDFGEGNLIYNVSFLNKRILSDGVHLAWNGDAYPWVEGVAGPGIGETLTIDFTEPSQDIVVLNGFVDPLRRHLYRHNNRVRTAIIRSADSGEPFEFEHTFEDVVHFDEIPLPRPARKVIFEIKDVYPGEKWDDTCISAVLTREPDPYK